MFDLVAIPVRCLYFQMGIGEHEWIIHAQWRYSQKQECYLRHSQAKVNIVQRIVWFLHTVKEMVHTRQSVVWVVKNQHSISYVLTSLPAYKDHTFRVTFVLAFNNAKNIPLSENIVLACVSFTKVSQPHPISIWRYRQLAEKGWPLDPNNTSCISYTIERREFAPSSFDTFWTTVHEYVPYIQGLIQNYCLHLWKRR